MDFKDAKRIVVKVGTSTITYPNGKLNLQRIDNLARVLSGIRNQDREVILVTSGAVGVGVSRLGMKKKPHDTIGKQAAAAVGQCELMNIYGKFFSDYGYTVSQVLITKDIVDHSIREENAKNTLLRLLELGSIPIVNENDTVAVEEIEFGDNDTLSAIVAVIAKADLLILLSDIKGLYDGNPRDDEQARLIPVVHEITPEIESFAGDSGTNQGTGGMITKIHAAKISTAKGIPMVIASGDRPEILYDITDGRVEGTVFYGNK